MSKFLVTDPCYIVPNEEWDRLVAVADNEVQRSESDWLVVFNKEVQEYSDDNIKMLLVSRTDNGDGSIGGRTESGKFYEIGVDAGMVCIAEIKNAAFDVGPFGALVNSFSEAQKIYSRAKRI